MKKIAVIILLIGSLVLESQAQSDVDALRYSMTNPLGSTSRSMGMGGAIGVLGADPASQLINPAGLAQYRSGVFSIGIDMLLESVEADYRNSGPLNSNYGKVTIPNVNLVFSNVKSYRGVPATSGWVNYSFGIGLNRTADFTQTMSFNGQNTQNSMLDYVASYVQGLSASALDANDEQLDNGFYYFENMFWYGYLIDTINNGNYYGYYDGMNPNQFQSGYIKKTGGMNEFNMTFAANYEHKVFFGFGVNIHSVNYTELNRFSETDNPATTGNWNTYDFTRNLNTSGYGFSGRLGLIVKPNDNVRVGASLTTPTFLNLEDNYYDELYVTYDNGEFEDMRTIDKEFSYTITTPVRYGLQGAYIFGKSGLISAEIEQVNYSTMGISSDNYGFENENQKIANKYNSATNIKIGGEMAFDAFRLRAGYAKMGNPFAVNTRFAQQFITTGFGIQDESMAIDLAVIKQIGEGQYIPYEINNISSGAVSTNTNGTRIALTFSYKF
ncbi:hypothetical protein GYB22_13800 [bacterium]|nr:hypothetical protein [bacterium]